MNAVRLFITDLEEVLSIGNCSDFRPWLHACNGAYVMFALHLLVMGHIMCDILYYILLTKKDYNNQGISKTFWRYKQWKLLLFQGECSRAVITDLEEVLSTVNF